MSQAKKSGTVFVIEDDREIRSNLKDVLEAEGYEVLTASNGREGLELFQTEVRPDVVILDLMMPVMNGFEFLAARRSLDKVAKVPVIVASAFIDEARDLRADDYIRKPMELDDILALVQKHCARATS